VNQSLLARIGGQLLDRVEQQRPLSQGMISNGAQKNRRAAGASSADLGRKTVLASLELEVGCE